MPEIVVTGLGVGGRAFGGSRPPALVSADAIDAFAEHHRKALRYLNRGSIVLAAVLDAVLARRWPEPSARPPRLGLVVGSAFGNQGETTRYFRAIRAQGPDQLGPMASYDVAVNAFVNFASLFFRATGPVQTLSSGAVSGLDALASGVSLLEWDEADAVLVAGIEHECDEVHAYAGRTGAPAAGASEAAVVMLLEREEAAGAAPLGAVLGVDTGFARSGAGGVDRVAAGLLRRRGLAARALVAVCRGPGWSGGADAGATLGTPADVCIDTDAIAGPCQVGAAGLLGAALVLARLGEAPAAPAAGLSLATDPAGWLGAALLGSASGAAQVRALEETPSCRP